MPKERGMMGRRIRKVAFIFLTLGSLAIVVDILQHYIILQVVENWFQTSEKKQHSFKSSLNIWPLGGATVEIRDLMFAEKDEKITVRSISLRKNFFQFKEVMVSAAGLEMGNITADSLKGRVERTQNELVEDLVFNELGLENVVLKMPLITLKTNRVTGDVHYKTKDKSISFAVNSPTIFLNEKEIIGLEAKGDLTVHAPRNGELVFKVKNIDELSHALVEADYLNLNQAQLLTFGGKLLSDKEGRMKVKLKFNNGNVYWGAVKLRG